jgi:hypothetical protein
MAFDKKTMIGTFKNIPMNKLHRIVSYISKSATCDSMRGFRLFFDVNHLLGA